MNRIPVIGDIVSIGRTELCMINVEKSTVGTGEFQRISGYWLTSIKRDDLGKVNPKTKQHFIQMMFDKQSNSISLSDITFHEQIKLKVNTTYTEK